VLAANDLLLLDWKSGELGTTNADDVCAEGMMRAAAAGVARRREEAGIATGTNASNAAGCSRRQSNKDNGFIILSACRLVRLAVGLSRAAS
jgi:hypothetical protein